MNERGFYIPMRLETIEGLRRLAREERRAPRDQAAVLLERAVAEALRSQKVQGIAGLEDK